MEKRLDAAQELEGQLKDSKTYTEQHLPVLKATASRAPETQALIGDIDALIRSQAQRGEILERLQTGYLDLIASCWKWLNDSGSLYKKMGPLVKRLLKQRIREFIHRFDIQRKSLLDVYPCADFVTYPSLHEGFGKAFREAGGAFFHSHLRRLK